MPFTGSHPAAVLPFLPLPLPASALVMGSLAPDLPFYVPGVRPLPTHTAVGTVTVDVLIGGACWAVWHGLLARPALAVAPAGVRGRLAGTVEPGLRRRLASPGDAARVLAALAVGSATHVLWDEFTHAERWGAEHIAVLTGSWRGRPVVDWAQDASGVVGAWLIARWGAGWWRRTSARPATPVPATRWVWPALAGAGALAGGVAARRAPDVRSAAIAGAFRGGGATGLTGVLLALGWHARRRTPPTGSARTGGVLSGLAAALGRGRDRDAVRRGRLGAPA